MSSSTTYTFYEIRNLVKSVHFLQKKIVKNVPVKPIDIGRASVDWTSLTAFKEAGLEDTMLGLGVWVENRNEYPCIQL